MTSNPQWQQPYYLRAKAVVRETDVSGRNINYRYFTLSNHNQLVADGVAEPLEDKPQTSSQKARMVNQGLTNENFDQWGFPIFDKQMFLFDDKVGGIYEAQRRIRQIEDRRGLVGHIRVSRRPGGALGVDWSSVKTYAQRDIYKRGITVEQYESISYQGLSTPNHYVMPKSVEDGLGVMSKSKKPRKVDMLGNTIRGRPRKYMPGTEPYKSAGWRQASAQRALEKTAAAGLPVPEELKKYAEGDFGEEEGEGTPKSKKKGKTPKIPKTPKTPKAAGTKGKKGKVVVEGDAAPSMDIDTPLAGPDTEQAEVPFTPMDIDTPSHPPKPTHNELSIPPSPTPVGEESTTVPGATLQPPAPPPPPPFRIVLPYAKKDKPSLNEEPAQAPAPFRIRQPYLPHKASVAQSPLGITPEASRVGAPPTPGTPTPSTAVKPRGRPPGKKTQVAGGKRQSKLSDLFGASAKKQKTTDTPSDSTPQTPTQPSATASPSPPTDDALLSHQLSQEMAAASSSPAQTPAQTSATAPERRGRASKADRLSTPAQNETAIAFAPGPNGFAYPYYPQPPPGYQWAYPPPHSQQGMVWGMPGQMPMQMMAPMAPMAPIAPMGQMMGPGGAVYMQAPPPGMDMKPPDSPSMLRARLMGMPMIPFDSEKNDRGGEGGKEAGEKQMEENADKLMEEASGVPETPKQTKKPLTEPPPSSATKRSTRPSKAAEEVEQVEASLAPTAPMEPPGSRTPSPRLTRRQLAQLQTSAEKVTPSPSAATKRQSSKPPTPSTSQSITSPRLTRRQAAAQALASPSPAQTVPSPVGPPLRRRGRQAAKSKEAESPKTPSGRQLLAVEINTPGSLRTRLMGGKMIEMEVAEEEEQLEASVETTEESKTTAPVAPNPKPAPEEPEAEPAAEAAIEPAPATKSDSEMEVVDGEDKENEVEAVPKSKRGRPKKRKRGFALAKAVKEMEIENPQNGTSKDVEYTDASSETHAAKKVRFEETKSLGGLPASEAAMETDIQAADATMSLPEAMEEDDVGPATGPSTAPIDLDASSPATETSGDTFDRQIVEVTDPDRNPNNDVFVQAINSRARRRLPSSDKKGYGGAGGMLSIARRQVILDLLEEYGGVFPGGMELRHAFKEKIMERNPKAGTPDRRLIVNVLNTLQSQGKVREIGFVFNNKRGMKVNKRIIMKANLSTDSPEVTAVKEEMVKADGTLWFPEGFKVTGLQIKHPPPPEVSRQMQEPTEVLEFERLYPASVINTKKAKEVAANIRELKRSLTIPPTASEALEILRHAKERDGEAHRTLNEIGKRNQAGRVKDQSKNWLLRIMNKDAEDLFSMDDGDESWMPRSLPPEIVQSEKSGVAFKPNLPEFPQTVADVEKGVDSVVFWEMYGHIRPEAVWDPTKELPEGTLIFINHYCPPLELCDNFDQEPVYFQDQVMKRVRFMNNPRQQNIDHAPGEKRPNGRPKGARPKVTGDEPVQFVWDKKRKKNIRKRHKAMEELYQEKAVVQDDPLLDSRKSCSKLRMGWMLTIPVPDRTIIGRKKYIFNKEEDDLLLYGTTIVRGLLSAASDRRIDWEIVKKILPHREIAALKSRWSTVRTLNKPRLRQLQADLEDCFLEDYAKGILPDFDPAKFDMVFHVNWFKKRMQAIDKPIPELPADYREFDEKFIVQEEQPTPDWRDAMFNSMLASGIRQEFFTNVSSSVPLSSLTSEEPEQTEQEKAQENARLVIKSNLVTDGSVYNQQEAYKLLGTFPQPSMHSAFETLSAKRTLAQCKPGIKVVPGRNFEFTDLFHQTFKSAPSLKIVRQAVAAERDLYSAFANGYEGYQLTHFVTDGMVAVLVNGLASGWLRFKREGFKADKRGLIEGYKTRMMDKKLLYFSITAIPTTVLPPPPEHLPLPSFEPSQGLGAYRTWFDINKTLVRGMWDTVRCAVVCTLLARPGVGINEIARLLGTGLEVREVREIVRWGLENDVLRVDSIENGERGMRVWAGERWWRGII